MNRAKSATKSQSSEQLRDESLEETSSLGQDNKLDCEDDVPILSTMSASEVMIVLVVHMLVNLPGKTFNDISGCLKIHEARRELKARFSESTLDFLARRGKKKNQQQEPSSELHPSGLFENPVAANPDTQWQSEAKDDMSVDMLGNPLPQVNRSSQPPPPHARLRFDLNGKVVGVLSMEEWSSGPNYVQLTLERDPLREVQYSWPYLDLLYMNVQQGKHDLIQQLTGFCAVQEERKVTAQGYMIEELTILARSQYRGHRLMAMKSLAHILARARPTVLGIHADPDVHKRVIPVPHALCMKEEITWDSIWHLATVELDVAKLALQSLGIGIVSEVLGALRLILAICGIPIPEEAVYYSCDSDPIGGKPMLWLKMIISP